METQRHEGGWQFIAWRSAEYPLCIICYQTGDFFTEYVG